MKNKTRLFILICSPLLALVLALGGLSAPPEEAPAPEAILDIEMLPAALDREIDFETDVQPILAAHCYECHSADMIQAGLRLDNRTLAMAGGDSGEVIIPHHSAASELLFRVSGQDEFMIMPPFGEGEPLEEEQVAILRTWIDQGAAWPEDGGLQTHWAYVPPVRASLPQVSDPAWCQNEIDYFILARLDKEGIAPSPQADRTTLARRVYLDLLGVPPTPAEVDTFLADTAPGAYERMVDRILASPRYGEHWARPWLDMARYADTQGYEKDNRRTIWRYRDWVIEAINHDLPFDQFTIDQLAGDLLPGATLDQRIATAFHRNTMTNTEGGTDNEQFRMEAVVDRVNTTFDVWQATTLACCQCHTHKYDPFTQREYYEMLAFFNQSADADIDDETPYISVPSKIEEYEIHLLEQEIEGLESLDDLAPEVLADRQAAWEERMRTDPPQWQSLMPEIVEATSGATCTIADDGSILVEGGTTPGDVYSLTFHTDVVGITALQLEALSEPRLPGGGPGRAENGRFLLTEIQATAGPQVESSPPLARFVRVSLPGDLRTLSLSEVQVFSGPHNVATKGRATQSSDAHGGVAARAIDGNTSGNWHNGSTTHTDEETSPWWELDLGKIVPVDAVTIWNRTDGNLHGRLTGAKVELLDAEGQVIREEILDQPPLPDKRLGFTAATPVEFVSATATCRPGDDFEGNPYAGWPAQAAIDGDRHGNEWGWSNGTSVGEPQRAVFQLHAPLGDQRGTVLQVLLKQGHSLGRFRISATSAAPPVWAMPPSVVEIVALPPEARTAAQEAELTEFYLSTVRDDSQRLARIEELRQKIESLASTTVPVMVQGDGRTTHILVRGSYLAPGDEVQAGTPAVLNPMTEQFPRNRLGLAEWLVSDENPLTGRVLANRHWEKIFGTGIVSTSEDFGTQGEPPSHPELLDWLALELVRQQWSVKKLHRLIVTSATYQQSSRVTPEMLEIDPTNHLLARGARVRLTAEQVRDQALTAAGLISSKMYGPGVMPPQPDGVWQVVYSGDQWVTPEGADRYRRGVYTFWRRTSPYPSMTTFDAPSREVCVLRRSPTNTPLQALVVLNDPVFLEASAALAERARTEAEPTNEARVSHIFRLCLGRAPTQQEVSRLVELYQSELAHYQANLADATALLGEANRPAPSETEAPAMAAWTIISSVILNLDETLTKG